VVWNYLYLKSNKLQLWNEGRHGAQMLQFQPCEFLERRNRMFVSSTFLRSSFEALMSS
jgi:hypothetical protein